MKNTNMITILISVDGSLTLWTLNILCLFFIKIIHPQDLIQIMSSSININRKFVQVSIAGLSTNHVQVQTVGLFLKATIPLPVEFYKMKALLLLSLLVVTVAKPVTILTTHSVVEL